MSTVLEIENLRVRFRIQSSLMAMLNKNKDPYIDAVRQVSFKIEEGQTFTLVGESGSGKSTLAYAVAGLLPVADGSIMFNGDDVTKMNHKDLMDYRKQVSMMWQNPVSRLDLTQTSKDWQRAPTTCLRTGSTFNSLRRRYVAL